MISTAHPIMEREFDAQRRPRDADEAEVRATIYKGKRMSRPYCSIAMIPGPKWRGAHRADARPAAVGGFVPIWPGADSGWIAGAPGAGTR